MLGINPVALAKAELAKLDHNHGLEDAKNAVLAVESAFGVISAFLAHVDAEDVGEILALLPSRLRSKIPAELLSSLADELPKLPAQLAGADAALKALEAALK